MNENLNGLATSLSEVVEAFLALGADRNSRDPKGLTPAQKRSSEK